MLVTKTTGILISKEDADDMKSENMTKLYQVTKLIQLESAITR